MRETAFLGPVRSNSDTSRFLEVSQAQIIECHGGGEMDADTSVALVNQLLLAQAQPDDAFVVGGERGTARFTGKKRQLRVAKKQTRCEERKDLHV